MASKKPSLQASLQQVAAAEPTARTEKKMLVCYVEKSTHRKLRMYAIENDKTMQALFSEAMRDFLEKYDL